MRKRKLPLRQPILPYKEFVNRVNQYDWSSASEEELKYRLAACTGRMWEQYSLIMDRLQPDFFLTSEPELHRSCIAAVGKERTALLEKQLVLRALNEQWSNYLMTMDNIREGIHLAIIGGEDPLEVYQQAAINCFYELEEEVRQDVVGAMKKIAIEGKPANLTREGPAGATTTWAYMIDDSKSQFARLPGLKRSISNVVKGSVFRKRTKR